MQVKREIVAQKEVIVTTYTKREVEMLEIIYVLGNSIWFILIAAINGKTLILFQGCCLLGTNA